jgi:hypothetical protein
LTLIRIIQASAGFGLLWSTTLMKDFYSDKPALQDLYYFLAGNY